MKVVYERDKCIGCGACEAVCPKYWKIVEDGKSKLLESEVNPQTGNHEKEVEKAGCNQGAADTCPVQCIHIKR